MKGNTRYHILLLAAGVMTMSTVSAKVSLPKILSSGMVVQREAPVKLWGTADPGESVTVVVKDSRNKTVGAKKGVKTTADSSGNWSVALPALKAGGPYTITIGDLTLSDVLSGDVFLCSGQSNMELPVKRVTDMFADEIASYSNPSVRHFKTPNEFDFHTARTDVSNGNWTATSPETSGNFSALAYFFANELNSRTGVPVGIINSSWGGTPVEAWMSEEAITPFPRALNEKRIYEDDAYRDHIKKVEGENYHQWELAMYKGDPGLHSDVKWYEPSLDDSDWANVDIIAGTVTDGSITGDDLHNGWTGNRWASDGLNAINGSHWFRKNIKLTADKAGKEAILRLGCIVDADSVYVNGRFVGNTTYMYPPRIYKVPAGVLKEGDNNITVRLISQNGQGSFVPEKPYKLIVDGEEIELGKDWKYRLGAPMVHGPGMEFYCYKPVVLYNAMINPYINLPLAGAVWYQGESNVARRNEYPSLLKAMITDWRKAFNQEDMPFYIVELADFLHPSDKGGRAAWAEMRKAQKQVADETPSTFLIKNSDLGEWNDIHPLDKKTLGKRVADAVTSKTK